MVAAKPRAYPRRVARHPDADVRHAAALELGRELATHFGLGRGSLTQPPRRSTPAEALLEAGDWMRLEDAFESLGSREQEVLDLRYGLAPASPQRLTQDEVGERLGISRSRVGQLEAAAVAKLDGRLQLAGTRPEAGTWSPG